MLDFPDFRDSTEIMIDGAALKERLDEDGYLFVRRLLPRETILRVRGRLLALAGAGGWLAPDRPVEDGIANPEAACKDPEERYMAVFRDMWRDEELHRLRTHPNVLAFFERVES